MFIVKLRVRDLRNNKKKKIVESKIVKVKSREEIFQFNLLNMKKYLKTVEANLFKKVN